MGIFFFKALLPGGSRRTERFAGHHDLFATSVQVEGYTTPGGTFVAPHQAIVHKRAIVAPVKRTAAYPDLFAPPAAAAAAKPEPTPRAPAKQKQKVGNDSRVDLFSVPTQPAKSAPETVAAVVAAEAPAPVPAESPPAAAAPDAPDKPAQEPATGPLALASFGVAPGTTKGERLALNAAARAEVNERGFRNRAVMAQYSGTGGVGESLNEYYTPAPVASAVWTLLQRAGFKGGTVLEPSAGTGVFLHTAPDNAEITAVEMDVTSSRICDALFGYKHDVQCSSAERFATQDGTLYDAVIGNPPFGLRGDGVGIDKKAIPEASRYFLDTALDKTKDGGLVALVLPSGVLDSSSGRAYRQDILCKGEFLGACRMPNTAFEASHTSVTTDVVLFRKRPQELAGALGTLSQDQLKAVGVWDEQFLGGTYMTTGRGMANVHGRLEPGWREKAGMGHDTTVAGSMVGVPEAVAAMPIEQSEGEPLSMQAVLASLGDDEKAKRRAVSAALKPPYQVAKLGDVRTVDGVRYVLQGDPARWHRAEEGLLPAVKDALSLAETLEDLHEGRAQDAALVRMGLIEDLDAYVAKHGQPARNRDLRQWLAGPSMPNEDGAEGWEHGNRVKEAARRAARLLGAVSEDGSYSDLVTGRTRQVTPLDLDTLATKLSLEAGGFDVGQLEAASGKSAMSVLDHLYASPAYAVAPDGVTWSTMDSYLSGELWPKFDEATAAAAGATDPALRSKWLGQVAALDATIAPKSLEDVEITFGAGFVEPHVITAWFQSKHDEWRASNRDSQSAGPERPKFAYSEDDAIWTATGVGPNAKLLLASLNRTGVRKDDKPYLDRINGEFAEWLRGSELRGEVEEHYNRTHRGFRAPSNSNEPFDIPGMNTDGLKDFQYGGVRWALGAGKGIIAADVGLGKTVRGLMLARLMQSTGTNKKPVIVVPKSVLANWRAEAEKWFPGSSVLVIGETFSTDKAGNVTSKPDDAATKRAKFHQLQQNTHDFVLVSMPAWNSLDVSPELKESLLGQDFWEKRGKSLEGASAKQQNKAQTSYDQDMASRDFADREATIYFDDLGIDALILDEGHAYKNLYATKTRFGEKPMFLGGTGQSSRAQDTFFKTQALRNAHDGKGVFMLTATPTKNSPLEIFSMLSHIAPEAFTRMGIKNSEEFIDRFVYFETDNIMGVDGLMKEAQVTAGFKNLDELREVMRKYIDRKTAADVGLVIPKGEPVSHYIEMTADQEDAYAGLREDYRVAKAAGGDATGDAHIFSIMSKMDKASTDLSLLTGAASTDDMPKVDACVAEAIKNSAEGGQLIFCDHIQMHERIAAKLVASGVPRSQIAILNGEAAKTGASRQKICDQFNSGKVMYVVGNTPTMGEGVNLQMGTADIHHLDLPWDPATMQQRNGRGVRQGNVKSRVRLHSYLAKRSFDGYRNQTIGSKRDWQDMLWNGGDTVENLARSGRVSRQEEAIMMSVDPEAAKAKYDADFAAALERKQVDDRGRAYDSFLRLNKMTVGLAKLRGETDPLKVQHTAIVRLEQQHTRLREALADMKGFDHKHLLDAPDPVVVEPTTNQAYTRGQAFTLAAGGGGPVAYSGADTKWMVTDVDPAGGTVTARPYGAYATTPLTMDLERFKEGVTPFTASDADESRLLDRAKVKPGSGETDGLTGQTMKLHELRHLPPAMLADRQAQVHARMMQSIEDHQDDARPHYATHADDGTAELSGSWSMRHRPAAKLVLPLPEHRAKVVAGYVAEGMNRRLGTTYEKNGTGIKSIYPTSQHGSGEGSNPWGPVLDDLYGPAARAEAKTALHAAVRGKVASAPSFRAALAAASVAVELPAGRWDRPRAKSPWPADVVRSLAKRAGELGVLDKIVPDAVEESRTSRTWAEVHHMLFQRENVDYLGLSHRDWPAGGGPYGRGGRSVRDFLGAIAHPDDVEGIRSAPKAAAERQAA